MLRRIGLENFKCWRELDIELAPITLFFGVNSSGKTAILESLLMLKQTVASRDPNTHLNFGGGPRDYVDLGSYRYLVHAHNAGRSVGLNLSVDLSPKAIDQLAVTRWSEDKTDKRSLYPSVLLQYNVVWSLSDEAFVQKLVYKFCENGRDANKIVARREEDHYILTHFIPDLANDSRQYIPSEEVLFSSIENCHRIRGGGFLRVADGHVTTSPDFISIQLERLLQGAFYLGPLRSHPMRVYHWADNRKLGVIEPNGTDTIDVLVSSNREGGQLVQHVEDRLKALDLVDAFDVKPIDKSQQLYEATATIGGVESALTDVGFGVSQVLPVVTMLLSAPAGSIILLEQPELHLHPNAQAALADLLLFVAESRNLQLIVESHSEHVVRRLQRRIAETKFDFATPENIKMYYCQPGESGSTIDEVDVDRFGQISNWPERFMGDISGDIHSMAKAAITRRRQELERVGSGG